MNNQPLPRASRRDFLKTTGQLAAASALAGVRLPHVHAADNHTIHLALIGCGGRGNGAVANAMSAGGLVLGDAGGTQRAVGTGAGGLMCRHSTARQALIGHLKEGLAPPGAVAALELP